MTELVATIEDLQALPLHAVLVDRIGMAWQVIQIGQDYSAHRGPDTRRNAFIQAGNHVTFEAALLADVLPMRQVSDGAPTSPEVAS